MFSFAYTGSNLKITETMRNFRRVPCIPHTLQGSSAKYIKTLSPESIRPVYGINSGKLALIVTVQGKAVTEFIDERLSSGVQVSEVAERCGMSYSYFAKKFLAVYGKTCKEYIEEMRIIKAEEFLVFTDFDLQKISSETGFSDCSHMIKSFKKLRGITPKQYRIKLAE